MLLQSASFQSSPHLIVQVLLLGCRLALFLRCCTEASFLGAAARRCFSVPVLCTVRQRCSCSLASRFCGPDSPLTCLCTSSFSLVSAGAAVGAPLDGPGVPRAPPACEPCPLRAAITSLLLSVGLLGVAFRVSFAAVHVTNVQSDLEVRATSSQVGQAPSWPVRCLTLLVLRVLPHGSRVPSVSHVYYQLSDLTFRVHVPSFHLLPQRCFAYLLLPHFLSHHLPVLFARPSRASARALDRCSTFFFPSSSRSCLTSAQ